MARIGADVPWARAGVGAIATQSFFNTGYGPDGLRLLSGGLTPEHVAARLTSDDAGRGRRQLGIVDAKGRTAAYTAADCMPWAGHATVDGCCVQGNALLGPSVLDGVAQAFVRTSGTLAERLVAALAGGQRHGGDRRGMQSAVLLVVRERGGPEGFGDHAIDLRVDDHALPIEELQRLLSPRLGS
ncbi:MAG: DUF1028 domain-containing protein [Chloroflexota bacterium]|nr:DUF1028 domain-containing protein [Chloroflexota bacterium]